MRSILEELYFGSVHRNFEPYSKSSDYIESTQLKEINYDKLMAVLNESEKERFEKYLEADGDLKGIEHYNTFTDAFKLGELLMVEVFAKESL